MRIPILLGILRGYWWLPACGGKILRILGGSYESDQTQFFQKLLHEGDTLLDIGANVGYYSLVSSKLVGKSGQVIAFEPEPTNFQFLEKHIRMNRCENIKAESVAISDKNGTAKFKYGSGTGTGSLDDSGELEVKTVRLDDFCTENSIVPNAIKIDVEGAEMSVLSGGQGTLESARPILFLSTHGTEVHHACLDFLRNLNYKLQPINGGDLETCEEVLCLPS